MRSFLWPAPLSQILLLAAVLQCLSMAQAMAPNTAFHQQHFLTSTEVNLLNSYLDKREQVSDGTLARKLVESKGSVHYVQSGYDQLHGTTVVELQQLCKVYQKTFRKVQEILQQPTPNSGGGWRPSGDVWQQHASFQIYHKHGRHTMHADTDIKKRCGTASIGLDSHRDGAHTGGRFVVFDPLDLAATTHASYSEAGQLVVFRAESLHAVENVTRGRRRVLHVWYGCDRPRCSDSACTVLQHSPTIASTIPIIMRATVDRIDPMVMACRALDKYLGGHLEESARELARISGCRVVVKDAEEDVIMCAIERTNNGPDPLYPHVRSDL